MRRSERNFCTACILELGRDYDETEPVVAWARDPTFNIPMGFCADHWGRRSPETVRMSEGELAVYDVIEE